LNFVPSTSASYRREAPTAQQLEMPTEQDTQLFLPRTINVQNPLPTPRLRGHHARLLQALPRLAIIMGTEGDGLPRDVVEAANYVARIPMQHGVDSLNVAAASAIAFWQLRKR